MLLITEADLAPRLYTDLLADYKHPTLAFAFSSYLVALKNWGVGTRLDKEEIEAKNEKLSP